MARVAAWSRGVLIALTLDDAPRIAAVVIFVATYVVIAIGKLPRFQLDRAGAALLGATLMVACGANRFHSSSPLLGKA